LVYTYPDYSYNWDDNPPPYNPDSAYNHDSPGSSLSTPSSNYPSSSYDDSHFNLNGGAGWGNSGLVQNGQTPQPEPAQDSPALAAQPQPHLVSQRS
jgi:hypothetical protein